MLLLVATLLATGALAAPVAPFAYAGAAALDAEPHGARAFGSPGGPAFSGAYAGADPYGYGAREPFYQAAPGVGAFRLARRGRPPAEYLYVRRATHARHLRTTNLPCFPLPPTACVGLCEVCKRLVRVRARPRLVVLRPAAARPARGGPRRRLRAPLARDGVRFELLGLRRRRALGLQLARVARPRVALGRRRAVAGRRRPLRRRARPHRAAALGGPARRLLGW